MTDARTVDELSVARLRSEQIPLAWPLARRSSGAADLKQWQQRIAELVEHGGGVLAAQSPDGLVHGIACFQNVKDPRAGPVLKVDVFATFELLRKAPVERILADALDDLAADLGCAAVWVLAGKTGLRSCGAALRSGSRSPGLFPR